MALIHNHSPVCLKSELDLFVLPPTQTSIEKGQWVEFHPLANSRDGGPLEFNISGSAEEYLDLSTTRLYVKVKIVKSDGSKLPDKEPVGPINCFLHSLFSQVDVSLNERVISSASNTYPYRAYIETLLNYGEEAKKTFLTSECFFKDTAGLLHEVNPTADIPKQGLFHRYDLVKNSQTLDLIGNLHCDLFHQNRLLLNLVDVKIKLVRSKPDFCLVSSSESPDYRVLIDHASIFVRKVKVSPGVSIGHAKALEKSPAKYPIDRTLCKVYSISQGSMSFVQDNVFLGQMPKRVVIGCVDNEAFNGTYKTNPFDFKHYDVNFMCVYIDGHPVPHKPLEPDFANGNIIRSYCSLFPDGKPIDITREEYPKGYTLFAFDLTPDLCDGEHMNLLQQGNLRVEIKFTHALEKTISVLIYAKFQNIIEITKSRSILCDYSN